MIMEQLSPFGAPPGQTHMATANIPASTHTVAVSRVGPVHDSSLPSHEPSDPSIQVGRLSLGNSPSPGAHTGTLLAPVARLGLLCSSGPRRPCWTSEANQSA